MTLLPRSLLWRAFMLISTLMLLAVAAWLAIFSEVELDRRARQISQLVASVTNLTRAALLAARPEHRELLLDELSDREGLRIYPAEPGDQIVPPPHRPLTARLEASLRERLGPETQLAFAVNGESGLFIRFRIFDGADGTFWLVLPRERLERHFPWQWIGWGVAVLLLSLLGAWLIVVRITRPLQALQAAATRVGAGDTAPPLPEHGPAEIIAVTQAFNQMNTSLQRLEEDRKLLLAGISHDLRTPLTRLRMETELSVSDAAARAAMSDDITEMDRTIGQFLDFARPPAAPAAPLEITPLLADIAARYDHRVTSADFASVAPIAAHATALPLQRAIVNLIENALRHGGAPVELQLREEGQQVVIAILDRGPGIAPADVERLRQPFTRGERARTDAGGAGLGLAIVDRIINTQGGSLELLPRTGGGLAAQIRLARA